MEEVFVAWAISAAVILLLAIALGLRVRSDWFGILIDERGRYSLTRFQVAAWTVVVLSLVSGVFFARLFGDVDGGALDFKIPDELLLVLGISVGSTALASAAKTAKDRSRPFSVGASDNQDLPRLSQMFLFEEGDMVDQAIDVTKFQNFVITVVLLVAYVALAVNEFGDLKSLNGLTTLPEFTAAFVTLLGISHAGYLAGKLPSPEGVPEGLTVGRRAQHAVPQSAPPPPAVGGPAPPSYTPRNPPRP